MPVSLTTLTGPIYMPNGATPVGGRVSFELSSWDREEGEALITSGPTYSDIDENGQFSVELFTTTEGVNTVNYKMCVLWEDSELTQSYVNGVYVSSPTPHYTKKYIGSFALAGVGPFQVSDLNIMSELELNSFDVLLECQAYALAAEASAAAAVDAAISAAVNANIAGEAAIEAVAARDTVVALVDGYSGTFTTTSDMAGRGPYALAVNPGDVRAMLLTVNGLFYSSPDHYALVTMAGSPSGVGVLMTADHNADMRADYVVKATPAYDPSLDNSLDYPSLAALNAAIAGGMTRAAVRVVTAGGLAFVSVPGSAAAGLPTGFIPAGDASCDHWGAVKYATAAAAVAGIDSAAAIQMALQSGLVKTVQGFYRCASAITLQDVTLSLEGDAPNGFVFTGLTNGFVINQHTAGVTIATTNYFETRLNGVGIYTTQLEAGTGLKVAYAQSVVLYARNENLVSLELLDIQGTDPRANGWNKQIEIVDVNHPMIDRCNLIGRQNASATPATLPFYMNATDGIYTTVTGDEEMNYVQIRNNRIKNCLYGIRCIGAGEGVVIIGNGIPLCDYGIYLDKTVADPNITDPQVMIFHNHINAATRGIYIKSMYEAQVQSNLLYSFPSVDTGSWAGVEADKLLQAVISDNIIEGFNSIRADRLVGILGTDIRLSQIHDNHYINVDAPVEFTTDKCTGNEVYNEKRTPTTDVSPMVAWTGTAVSSRDYAGPVSTITAGVAVTASTTTIATVSQDVWGGRVYKIEAVVRGTKGATAGNVITTLAKTSGTAVIAFSSYQTAARQVAISTIDTLVIVAYFTTATAGTLGISLQATSGGSDFTVAAGQASITITKL
jgi:hypothetical protein